MLLSIREYARQCGVSHTAILKRIKHGKVSLVDGKIDPAKADAEWGYKRDALQAQRGAHSTGKPKSAPRGTPVSKPAPKEPQKKDDDRGSLEEAQRLTAWLKAKEKQIDLKEREEELLQRSEITRTVGDLIVTAKTHLRSIGAKIAPELAAESDAARCQSMVDAEIDEALSDISRWQPTQ